MKSRNKKVQTWSKRKVAAGIVSLTVIITASAGISYADTDLAGSMTSWFTKKTGQVMQNLDASITSETETQKELLKKELQLRLEASSRNLEAFTEEQKRLHSAALGQYAQNLLAKVNIRSEQDRAQIVRKLQAIQDSAQAGMDALVDSYVPPNLVFVPTVPSIIIAPPPPPPPPPPPSTVVGEVYGVQSKPSTVVEVTYKN
ncbi:hypothetical protein [Paenibacillus qinlingensis]|uniref:OmpH family outer membrane protein n=1 Tax=Paenibacillus qinlingensis TaxID=1837343 RepID=A0ABU1P3U7_9BACL|nr:hypothetical protein [Paenibacillus qinlingensis]MDR6554224.1 hypothetical protein [Paenibacillus qinlingensis]